MKKEVKIGITLLGGIFAVYLVIAWASQIHLFAVSKSSYEIVFQDVSGLKTGDPVSVYGYEVGSVAGIRLEGKGAVVEVVVDDELELKEDASAQIQIKELMGGKRIDIMPGNKTAIMPPGSRFDGDISMDFTTAFVKMGEFMDGMNPEAMDSLMMNLNRVATAFGGLSQQLDGSEITGLFADLSSSAKSLNSLLGQVENRQLVGEMDSALVKMDQLAGNADEVMTSFNTLSAQLQDGTLPKTEKALEKLLSMLDQTEKIMTSAEDVLNQMKDKNTFAGKVLYDDAFAKQIENTLGNLNETLEFIRTKKIHVAMSLSHKQKKKFKEEVQD